MMILSAGLAEASPWGGYGYGYGHDRDRGGHYDRGYGRGYDRGPGRWDRSHRYHRTEMQAQLRLRQLGYYRGPIDGIIGRGTRYAIVRFQRDYRLPVTGRLDHRTLRALRVIR